MAKALHLPEAFAAPRIVHDTADADSIGDGMGL